MSRFQRVTFRVGAIGALVTAALHLVGHFQGATPAANETEATLWSLLTTYAFDFMGTRRTLWRLFEGFSLSFSVLLGFVGVLDLGILRARREDTGLLRLVAAVNAAGFGVLLLVSVFYFIPPPTICLGIVTAAFSAAVVGSRAQ